MPNVNVKSGNDTTKQTPTQILNQSFDQTYQVLATESVGYDSTTGALVRVAVDSNGSQKTQIVDGTNTEIGSGLATSANQTNGDQQTKIKETSPVDATKFNSSTLISYNAAGEAVYVDEINGGITYRTTFTRGDMVVTSTLPISAAVQQP